MPETLETTPNALAIRPRTNGAGMAQVVQPRSQSVPLPEHIIAASEEMREIVSVVRAIAPTAITVLLIGESGTGKEVFAELIHDLSGRKGPFVTVNCGAIPEGLIESELFGHEKGAFTGATNQRKGFFEAAQEGTLFLDEIGDMPLALQVKLLRALETGTFTRVGSTTLQKTNARIVAATNRDLERDVRAGTFRSDLYYRLRAVMLRIPPLRNRREDIPFLIEAMLDEFVHKHRIVGPDGKPRMPQIAPDAIQLLIDHEWRGNIRELRNTLEQLVVLVCSVQSLDGVCRISAQDIERALSSSILGSSASGWDGARSERPLPAASVTRENPATERELIYRALIELRADLAEVKELLRQKEVAPVATNTLALPARTEEIKTLQQLENEEIQKSLNRYDGNRRNAAHALGISERSLYRKLKEMGIE